MILSHVEQISLMNSMEKVYVKVNSENGESEQDLMESTKIRKGNERNCAVTVHHLCGATSYNRL